MLCKNKVRKESPGEARVEIHKKVSERVLEEFLSMNREIKCNVYRTEPSANMSCIPGVFSI